MKRQEKVKVTIKVKNSMAGCPQGMLRHDKGTPGPKCKA